MDLTITIDHPPRRIVSLVPSQTELLYTLGLGTAVVGITKFCVHPTSWFREKTRVGGTKNIYPGTIDTLKPDLIIANKEENHRLQIEALFPDYPVWVSDVNTLQTALEMITAIGELTGKDDQPRYPSIDLSLLADLDCDLVLLSSEPYPFRQQHIAEINSALPHAAIRLVDGEMFSWYGSRLPGAPAYFQQLRDDLIQKFDL